jgi:hypothetical protein
VDPGAVEGTNLRVLKYPHPSLRFSHTCAFIRLLTHVHTSCAHAGAGDPYVFV